jgi:hypothetical protein
MLNKLLLAVALALVANIALAFDPPIIPDHAKTPGDVLTTDAAAICVHGYTKTVRDVPQAMKDQIYSSYGITDRKPREYEIDHLVSLELGGSNSARNLWPQSYLTQPLNAHTKDKLENRMHKLVCDGQLDIRTAQQEIAKDWIGAYAKYIGPVPGYAATPTASKTPVPQAEPSTSKAATAEAVSCGSKRTCGQMASCEEARHYLNDCGVSKLDRDHDGTPCESLCK